MNNELLNAAKDEAAREYKYESFEHAINECLDGFGNLNEINPIVNRAMEIYAEMVVKNEPCNHPFDKVVQNNGDCVCFKCGHKIK